MFRVYRQVSLTLIASESLKLSFTLNCVFKRDHRYDDEVSRIAFDVRLSFEAVSCL